MELELKKATEFDKDPRTIRSNKKKYIAFKYTDYQTKRGGREYWLRYIEVKDVIDYLKEKGLI